MLEELNLSRGFVSSLVRLLAETWCRKNQWFITVQGGAFHSFVVCYLLDNLRKNLIDHFWVFVAKRKQREYDRCLALKQNVRENNFTASAIGTFVDNPLSLTCELAVSPMKVMIHSKVFTAKLSRTESSYCKGESWLIRMRMTGIVLHTCVIHLRALLG